MRDSFDMDWVGAGFDMDSLPRQKPNVEVWRWSFAYLPDAHMKTIVAGWMMRVWLGADPAVLSQEEIEALSVGALLAADTRSENGGGLRCDA
ncbi:MAG TPA: hypothetical protein VIY53_10920 [Acidobacteriaceae bacterium]